MKTLKLLLCAALLLGAYMGYSQCNAAFAAYNYGSGLVSFQSTFYPDTGVIANRYYLWSFGDGSTDSTVVAYDTHTYSTSGNYLACLTVVDNNPPTCNDQSCDTVAINLCADNINFFPSLIGFGLDTFTSNLSTTGGFTATWNFGDGGSATGINASHQFTANGNYNVCLYVAGTGCTDTICQQLGVNICQTYNPDFTFSLLSSHPYIGVFLPTNPNPSNYTYSWLYPSNAGTDGDTIFYPLGANTSVTMLVTSPGGCVDSVTKTFNLDWCDIQPSISETSNGLQATLAALIGDTTVPGTTYNWLLPGAGVTTATGEYVNATYSSYGTYTATVIITAQGGCTDTLSEQLNITAGVYGIGGWIDGGTSNGNATVYLITQDTTGHLALVDSTVIAFIDSGISNLVSYYFNNLPADTYYVKAALDSPNTGYYNYLPTYYTSSLSWSTATPVVIDASDVSGINITLTPGNNPGGPGFVGGYVSQGAGLLVQPNGGNITRGVGDALAGIQINLLTANEDAVAYTYTDASGHYQFSNLAYGDYKIYAEQLNKRPTQIPFTLSASDSSISSLNLSINSDSTYATAITSVNQITLQQAYPNPVINQLQVQLTSAQTADATVKLVDVLGQTALVANTRLIVGNNKLQLDMQNFAAGVYDLIIQTRDQHCTYKVVKAK
jgi:PKD repeat protein